MPARTAFTRLPRVGPGVGVGEEVLVPLPNSPFWLSPQHRIWPATRAQVWLWPALRSDTEPLMPVTSTGTFERAPVGSPLPSWPRAFSPQQLTAVLPARTAQV